MTDRRTAQCTRLQDMTPEDCTLMTEEYREMCTPEVLTDRVLGMLQAQKGHFGGAQVDLLEHGLQTATRAYRDGADEETVVCCLLHDIGELLSPSNHGDVVAGILRPYVSDKAWWILAHHEVFQGYYYFDMIGGDKNKREVFKDNPFYKDCVDFCEKWDAPSFDPNYNSLDLEFFRPMVKKIFSRTPFFHNQNHPKAVAVLGKMDNMDQVD